MPPKKIITGEQIYNAIMGEIEPDLVTTSGVSTDVRRRGESKAKWNARMERYRKAFALYEKCFTAYVAHLRDASKKSRAATRIATERKFHDEEEATANKLLSDITHA